MATKSPLYVSGQGVGANQRSFYIKDESGAFKQIMDPNEADLSQGVRQLAAGALDPKFGTVNFGGGNMTRTPTSFTSRAGTLESGNIYIGKAPSGPALHTGIWYFDGETLRQVDDYKGLNPSSVMSDFEKAKQLVSEGKIKTVNVDVLGDFASAMSRQGKRGYADSAITLEDIQKGLSTPITAADLFTDSGMSGADYIKQLGDIQSGELARMAQEETKKYQSFNPSSPGGVISTDSLGGTSNLQVPNTTSFSNTDGVVNSVGVLGERIGRDAAFTGLTEDQIIAEQNAYPNSGKLTREAAIGNLMMKQAQGTIASANNAPSGTTSSTGNTSATQPSTGGNVPQSVPATGLEAERESLINQFKSTVTKLEGRGNRILEEENKSGIPGMVTKLNDIDSQIAQLKGEYETLDATGMQQINKLSSQPIEMGLIVGQQREMKRQIDDEKNVIAAKIGALGVMREALTGNINTARQLAERTVNLEFSGLEQQLKNIEVFLDLNSDQLSAADKKEAEKIKEQLDIQKSILAEQKANKRENYDLMMKVAEAGGDPSIIDLNKTPAENLFAASRYVQMADTQTQNFTQDLVKKGYKLANSTKDLEGLKEDQILRMSDVISGDKRIFIAPENRKLLTVSEAKALGLPYGTTVAEAASKGLTPTGAKKPGAGGTTGGGSNIDSIEREYQAVINGLKSLTSLDKNTEAAVTQRILEQAFMIGPKEENLTRYIEKNREKLDSKYGLR